MIFISQSRTIQRRQPSGRHMKHCLPFPSCVSPKIQPLNHRHHNLPINIRRRSIQKIPSTLPLRKTQPRRRRLSGRQANTISPCGAAMLDSAFARIILPLQLNAIIAYPIITYAPVTYRLIFYPRSVPMSYFPRPLKVNLPGQRILRCLQVVQPPRECFTLRPEFFGDLFDPDIICV